MPSNPPKKILCTADLAKEFNISTEAALKLMQREDFPSTEISCEDGKIAYVVDRKYLNAWVAHHSRRVSQINCDFPVPKGFEHIFECK